jgi:uncharacterized small protein (DUF1192 family)
MTYSLDLIFRKPSKGDLPGPGIARIYIKTHTRDKEGHISITPNCVSMRELEEQIECLKQELETIKKKAKQKFAKKANKK